MAVVVQLDGVIAVAASFTYRVELAQAHRALECAALAGSAGFATLARRIEQVLRDSPSGGVVLFRTRAEIEGMLPGLELIEPGLVHCADWRLDRPRTTPLDPVQQCLVGAVGRKP